jgi:hypothetical protein
LHDRTASYWEASSIILGEEDKTHTSPPSLTPKGTSRVKKTAMNKRPKKNHEHGDTFWAVSASVAYIDLMWEMQRVFAPLKKTEKTDTESSKTKRKQSNQECLRLSEKKGGEREGRRATTEVLLERIEQLKKKEWKKAKKAFRDNLHSPHSVAQSS